MKITLAIPENLVKEAMNLSDNKNLNKLIVNVLQDYIKFKKRRKLIMLKGTLDSNIDLDILRSRDSFEI